MLLITDLPRDTGVGQYVHDLALTNKEAIIFFRDQITLEEYENCSIQKVSNSLFSEGYYYSKLKILSNKLSPISHLTWEGFGPVIGPKTKLITIHHVLPPNKNFMSQNKSLRAALVNRFAVSGYTKVAKWGITSIVPSNVVKQELIRYYSAQPEKIEVIPHAIDTGFFIKINRDNARNILSLPDSKFIILTVGHDDLRKNIEVVFNSFKEMKKKFSDVMWIHLGKSAFLSQLRDKKLDIFLINNLPKDKINVLYSACDVVLLLSFKEGFSYTLLEALSCNTRVITSNLEIFKEQMGSYYDGIEPTIDEVVAKLTKIYKCEDSFDFNAMRRMIVNRFSLGEFAKRSRTLYENVGLIE